MAANTRKGKLPDNEEFPRKKYKGEGRVAFLASLSSIREMIQAGWPLQAVYDRHAELLGIKYMQFHRYVTEYIKPKANAPPAEEKDTGPMKPMPVKPTEIKSFKKGPSDPKPKDVWY